MSILYDTSKPRQVVGQSKEGTEAMSEELKPCPFCGGAARIESNRDWHRLYAAHDDDCVFDADDHMLMYPAQPGHLLEIAEVWNRRAASTSPASDAELPPLPVPDMYLWWDTFGIQRMGGKAPEHYHAMSFFSLRQMRDYARTAFTRTASEPIAWGAWRKSLGRFHILSDDKAYIERVYGAESDGEGADFEIIPLAASDTRTAAESVECDSALRAAPASQLDARESARRLEITQVMLEQERVKNAHLLDVLMSIYRLSPRGEDIKLPDGRVFRFNDPNAAETLNALGRAIHAIPEKCAKALATRSRAEGGNTKQAALQELVDIAQANNMGYGPPAVDVEAERELFEAAYFACNLALLPPIGSDGRPIYANRETDLVWQGWLAARTQADAGKDGALLDFLDQWVAGNKAKGQHWFTFAFDTNKTAREQIKAEMDLAATKPEKT